MAGAFRIIFHYAAFNQFRRQQVIQDELDRRGHLIAEAAGGEPDFVVISELTGSRARTTVITATPQGMEAEADGLVLTRAIDAGKG